jgi:hypothetical protein
MGKNPYPIVFHNTFHEFPLLDRGLFSFAPDFNGEKLAGR